MSDSRYEARNVTRGATLATRVLRADSIPARLRGLLGRDGLEADEGLHLVPCNSVHTFFMRFPIDVLFLDGAGRVVRGLGPLAPWRATRIHLKSRSVLELPAGRLLESGTAPGDMVAFAKAGRA